MRSSRYQPARMLLERPRDFRNGSGKVTVAGLYWAVKKMITDLAAAA